MASTSSSALGGPGAPPRVPPHPPLPDFGFPTQYLLGRVANNKGSHTFVFRTADADVILQHFNNVVKPGLKRPTGSSKLKALKAIRFLGPPPVEIVGWTEVDKTSFPPATEYIELKCKSTDLNHKRPKTKATHIAHDHLKCNYEAVVRHLSMGGVSLMTFDEACIHTCPEENFSKVPLTAQESDFLIQTVLKYGGDVERIFKEVIAPAIEKCLFERKQPTRLLRMRPSAMRKFVKRLGLPTDHPQRGEDDLRKVREVLVQLKEQGAVVGWKMPGVPVSHPETILEESSKQYLDTKDTFIFLMTDIQMRLLRRFGTCIAADGTHAVFAYSNLKLIVVLVTSFDASPDGNIKERGFPVALVLTTSEREQVHRAIVTHIRSGVGQQWTPRLLMTDMAFGAYNAWSFFFPGLIWLWCVFHVYQAWIRKLSKAVRPDGIGTEEFSGLRGSLIKEVTAVISPKTETPMTEDEFQTRCRRISLLFWGAGLYDVAKSWDNYVERSERWSPPARDRVVMAVFGALTRMPKLSKSNNALERFFGVLKHRLLAGVSAKTICAFLCVWKLYLSQIYINALESNILGTIGLIHAPRTHVNEVAEEGDLDDDLAEQLFDGLESDSVTSDAEDQRLRDEEESVPGDDEFETPAEIPKSDPTSPEEWTSFMNELERDLIDFRKIRPNGTAMQGIKHMYNQLKRAITSQQMTAVYDGSELGFTNSSAPFVKQKDNFDTSPEFVPLMAVTPRQPTQDALEGAVEAIISTNQQDAPSASTDVPTHEIDLSMLNKDKRPKLTLGDAPANTVDFATYADALLQTKAFQDRIKLGKELAANDSLPCLRVALSWNTSKRIRGIACHIFKEDVCTATIKQKRISQFIAHILSKFPSIATCEAAKSVADVGIFIDDDDTARRTEVVFLCANSANAAGEPCVSRCETYTGLLPRGDQVLTLAFVQHRCILRGRLQEKIKTMSLE